MNLYYSTYGDYMVILDITKSEFKLKYKKKVLAQKITFESDGKKLIFCEADSNLEQENNLLTAIYKSEGRKKKILYQPIPALPRAIKR